MNITLQTEMFKELVSKVVKGVGNNKLLPLTQLIAIEAKDGKLRLITCDATSSNYLYVYQNDIPGDFYAVVVAEQFSKLISKLTSDKITMTIDNGVLKVSGNGSYTMALQYDEMGNDIKYPDPISEVGTPISTETLSMDTVNRIINSVKPALAETMEAPYLTNYYFGEQAVASDGYVIASLNQKILDEPTLMTPNAFELVALSRSTSISVNRYDGGIVILDTSDIKIYTREMSGLEDYPINAIQPYIETPMEGVCKIPKNETLNALDRLSLFVGTYDDDAIKMQFTADGLVLHSLASTGIETIKYVSPKNLDFECAINLKSLAKHIKSQSTDTVELQYGNDSAIKLIDGDLIQIIDLMDIVA